MVEYIQRILAEVALIRIWDCIELLSSAWSRFDIQTLKHPDPLRLVELHCPPNSLSIETTSCRSRECECLTGNSNNALIDVHHPQYSDPIEDSNNK